MFNVRLRCVLQDVLAWQRSTVSIQFNRLYLQFCI